MSDLHLQFRLGISTISGIVEEVCKLIWNVLQSEYMPIPDRLRQSGYQLHMDFQIKQIFQTV